LRCVGTKVLWLNKLGDRAYISLLEP
jgi:hypothetical protein